MPLPAVCLFHPDVAFGSRDRPVVSCQDFVADIATVCRFDCGIVGHVGTTGSQSHGVGTTEHIPDAARPVRDSLSGPLTCIRWPLTPLDFRRRKTPWPIGPPRVAMSRSMRRGIAVPRCHDGSLKCLRVLVPTRPCLPLLRRHPAPLLLPSQFFIPSPSLKNSLWDTTLGNTRARVSAMLSAKRAPRA